MNYDYQNIPSSSLPSSGAGPIQFTSSLKTPTSTYTKYNNNFTKTYDQKSNHGNVMMMDNISMNRVLMNSANTSKSANKYDYDKRYTTDIDESKGMQEIRPSIINTSRSLKHSFMLKKSNNNQFNPNKTMDAITTSTWKEDPHWPEAYLDALDKTIQKINAPDIILMEEAVSSFKFSEMSHEEIWKMIRNWKFLPYHDDIRFPFAHKNGGKVPENDIIMKKVRYIAKEVIMNLGKKLLSGNFNLTTVSFPIKAMVPQSLLENIALGTCYFPLYLNLGAQASTPLDRFKYYIVASIAYYYLTNSFAKTLNPILGETMHGYYNDGSHVFLEQTSHHPPISYILMLGANNSYKYYGPSIFNASAGLNSLTVIVKGWRKCIFTNPRQEISSTFPNEVYDHTLLGQVTHETLGSMQFIDKDNDIQCELRFGKVKKKPSDYIEGEIKVKGNVVSKITGTYLGWIEIDGNRYFDYRHLPPYKFFIEKSRLGSDFAYRPDLYFLQLGDVPKAQREKETLEQVQRYDAKLRKMHMEKMGRTHGHKK